MVFHLNQNHTRARGSMHALFGNGCSTPTRPHAILQHPPGYPGMHTLQGRKRVMLLCSFSASDSRKGIPDDLSSGHDAPTGACKAKLAIMGKIAMHRSEQSREELELPAETQHEKTPANMLSKFSPSRNVRLHHGRVAPPILVFNNVFLHPNVPIMNFKQNRTSNLANREDIHSAPRRTQHGRGERAKTQCINTQIHTIALVLVVPCTLRLQQTPWI